MGIEVLYNYLHRQILKVYDPGYDGEYKPRYNIWQVRGAILLFVLLSFHWLNNHPVFTIDAITISELLYLLYIGLVIILLKKEISVETQLFKLIMDFAFITLFEFLALSIYDLHSGLYVLFFVPVIFCSYWFRWNFTLAFVLIVAATYSCLNYELLNFATRFKSINQVLRILGPMSVNFILVAMGTSYYKRRIRGSREEVNEKIENHTADLKQEKEFTQKLLESSFDAIIAIDEDGIISKANNRACELLGYESNEIVGQEVVMFYGRDEARKIMRALRNSIDGSVKNFNTSIINRKEEKIPILLSATFLYKKNEVNLKNELFRRKKFPTLGFFRDLRAENAVDEIAKNITSKTNEKVLLDNIVKKVAPLLKAESCSLLRYNEKIMKIRVITSFGMPSYLSDWETWESYEENEGMIGRCFSHNETLNVPNIDVINEQPKKPIIKWSYAKNYAKYSRFQDFQHFLGTPIELHGETYGVIRVINKYVDDHSLDKNGFTSDDVKLLKRISTQVSMLIEKVWDKERFEAIDKIGRELNEMLDVDIDEMLQIIAKEVVKGMRLRACYLRLLEDGDILRIKASFGLNGRYLGDKGYDLKVGVGIAGKVAYENQHQAIEDLKSRKDFEFKDILKKENLRAMLSMPLRYGNRVIGVINCYTSRFHIFTEQEIQVLRTFAAYASTAIQNKKRVDEFNALNEISRELVKPIKKEELFSIILDKAKKLSGADRLCIKMYNEKAGKVETACSKNCPWHDEMDNHTIVIGEGVEGEIVNDIIKNGKFRIINDYYKEIQSRSKNQKKEHLLKDIQSCAIIPILIDEKVYGLLFLDSFKKDFFTKDDLLVLKAFSSQAAIAIKNAKFLEKLQTVTGTFPKISELNTNIDAVLRNIAKIAANVLETDVLVLYQYNAKTDRLEFPPICEGDIKYPKYMETQVDETDAPLLFINRGQNHYAEKSQEDPVMAPKKYPPRDGIPERFLFREQIYSSAGILLRVGQETVGVMFINYRTPHKFDKDEKEIIENYTSYIAIAIQNVRHFKDKEAGSALKTLGELAGKVAHKMKNDIGTINFYTEDLLDDTDSTDPKYIPLSRIKKNLKKITTDIDYLLNTSTITNLKKKYTRLENLIDELEEDILPDFNAKDIGFEKKIEGDIPALFIDPVKVKLVLSNLAHNSMDALPGGGKISVTVAMKKKDVVMSWRDSGIGISSDYEYKVFEPFWTTKGKGFGLGLFHTKAVVEEHGGSITIDKKVRKGTKFIIKLPVEVNNRK